jgi:hypothetical protein
MKSKCVTRDFLVRVTALHITENAGTSTKSAKKSLDINVDIC